MDDEAKIKNIYTSLKVTPWLRPKRGQIIK